MEVKPIEVDLEGPLAVVTLRRPERRNAFDAAMFAALAEAARTLERDPRLRVVIVTGAGDQAFSAGFDVNPDNPMVAEMARALEHGDETPVARCIDMLRAAVDRFTSLPVPVIAALNGNAYGGGAELAVRCDLRIMDPGAEICFSEVRLGLMPDWGGGATLGHLVGPAVAADLILSARPVGAQEALRLGLVNRISEAGKAFEAARQMAASIMANGPQAVRSALQVVRAGRGRPLAETLELERQKAVALITSGECLHGIAAFLAGEAPHFPDPGPGG